MKTLHFEMDVILFKDQRRGTITLHDEWYTNTESLSEARFLPLNPGPVEFDALDTNVSEVALEVTVNGDGDFTVSGRYEGSREWLAENMPEKPLRELVRKHLVDIGEILY